MNPHCVVLHRAASHRIALQKPDSKSGS